MSDGIPLNPGAYTSISEKNAGLAANGTSPAPPNSKPHVVERGQTVSEIMAANGLDYGDENDRALFYQLNPQFAPPSGRSDDLIYPDEVLYMPETAASGDTGETGETGKTGDIEGAENPPTSGTTSQPNGDGTATFQNHRNGYPAGPPYTAQVAANGNPVYGKIVDQNGGMIQTDAQGNPATGWVPVAGTPGSPVTYAYYVDGRPTTAEHVTRDDGTPPPEPPPTQEKDFGGQSIGTGWYPVNGSSQGATYAYFVDGHRVDAPTVTSPPTDGSPPNIAPPPPQNGTVMTVGPDQAGNATFQNYRNGEPYGEPYQAPAAENGMPKNQQTINANGGAVMTGSDGKPVTGWVGESGAAGTEQTYTYYVNGLPTDQTEEGTSPPADPPAGREKDYANQPIGTGWYVVAGSSQGVLYAYFVDGHRIEGTSTTTKPENGNPPNIAPSE